MSRAIILSVILAASVGAAALWLRGGGGRPGDIRGIVWQVDNATVDIDGDWHKLGAHELLVQWTVVDDLAFITGTDLAPAPRLPDWRRISGRPWAREVILGLAGRFGERDARENVKRLAEVSAQIARLPTPLNVVGWYFPVEVDPTWQDAPAIAPLLADLPRPLWISVYDSANVGADTLADWLAQWLPADVGVLFQDGVGVHARNAAVARDYADALAARLGRERLRVIVEAFRPDGKGGFRPATADELSPQIEAMAGHPVYLFDGPHYVDGALVEALSSRGARPD